jgi:hypothetical protein
VLRIFSEVNWCIVIDKHLVTKHLIDIRVLQWEHFLPSIHNNLAIGLPRKGALFDFQTTINGETKPEGYGRVPNHNMWVTPLTDITKNAKAGEAAQIQLRFTQKGAVQGIGELRWYDVDFWPRLFQQGTTMTVKVDLSSNRVIMFLSRLTAKLRRDRGEFLRAIGREPDERPAVDTLRFSFREELPIFTILFSKPTIPVLSYVGGFIIGLTVGVLSTLLGGWLLRRFWGS